MPFSEPVRTASRRTRWTLLAAFAVVCAATIGVLEHQSSGDSPPAASSALGALSRGVSSPAGPPIVATPLIRRSRASLPELPDASAGLADGVLPDGVTVFDGSVPAVSKLNPALLSALRQAATVAGSQGITFYVNSGWRSPKYQEQLLREAISKYGSEQAASRWVATPDTSAHVSGNAVDLGHSDATKWLSTHGARYGLCQIYRNESWHYELRPDAIEHGCPAMYADPSQDPRMQQ